MKRGQSENLNDRSRNTDDLDQYDLDLDWEELDQPDSDWENLDQTDSDWEESDQFDPDSEDYGQDLGREYSGDFEDDQDAIDFEEDQENQDLDKIEEHRKWEKTTKRRGKRRQGGKIWLALIGVCLCVMGFSVYQLVSIYLEYKAGTDEYQELQQYVLADLPAPGETKGSEENGGEAEPEENGDEAEGGSETEDSIQRVSFDELKEINSNIVGWIQIPGTKISYPVLQGSDDAYYLNHTFRDKVNSAGSIFMETLNRPDFMDYHTIIYGHNMKNGSMFGGLSSYRSPTYLVAHPYIYIDVEGGLLQYEIFSCYETTADSDSYTIGFAPDEVYADYLETIQGRSLYDTGVSVGIEDQVLTLSTCTKSGKEHRFVVHAKRI
ncbi:MAG: class B sortase [Lachnospiraceae bacterium]|jgi:sortase B|nr:class B sortase [Lachnospiraceae bacterium]